MKGISYFIAALPRSRTAWTANYLSCCSMFCIHDGMKYCHENVDELDQFTDVAKVVGDCDTAAVLFQDQLIARYPNAKWVIINRPYKEVSQSIRQLGVVPGDELHYLDVKIKELRTKVNPLEVDYHALNESIKDIAKYVHPDWENPQARHDMLIQMNVTMDAELGKDQILQARNSPIVRRAEPHKLSENNLAYWGLIKEITAPDQAAYDWFYQLVELALVWDHLVDEDPTDYAMTDRAMKSVLTQWPLNPFWQANSKYLLPTLSSAINRWQYSYLEGASKENAYAVYVDIPAAMGMIIGNQSRVDMYLPRLRQMVDQLMREDEQRDSFRK